MLDVRDGDVRKLGLLFERHQAPLFNFYLRMTGDRSLSEDLVQDAFFRILRSRHTFQAGSSFVTWMYHIARNACYDEFRRRKPEVGMDPERQYPSAELSPAENLAAEQETAMLRRALERLPHERRELLVLSRFQGLKYEQIAELLGCQTGTVKQRVFRALGELRQIYFNLESGCAAAGKD